MTRTTSSDGREAGRTDVVTTGRGAPAGEVLRVAGAARPGPRGLPPVRCETCGGPVGRWKNGVALHVACERPERSAVAPREPTTAWEAE
jgi:hypothetical protein